MDSYFYNICFITIFTSFLIQIHSEKHVALFIFGDSLFDPKSISGHIIPDFIAEYAGSPLIPPYSQPGNYGQFVQGFNFAYGGAGALVETHKGYVVDLKAQLKQFQNITKLLKYERGKSEVTKITSKAVYMFSIGTNDYSVYPPLSTNTSEENYVSMVVGNITYVIKEINKEGGKKFAFISLLPIGCLPHIRLKTGACNTNLNKLARQHNKVFSKVLKNLQDNISGFKYSIFDFYNTSKQRINHPSKYGFKEGRIPCCWPECCNNPWAYVFYNAHPSEKADEQFAQLAWNGTFHVVAPYNFRTLFNL